ncbi:MAG: carbohydrate ABC transporter permease [Candidatus Eremiobacteraeota bacterium]|nr:carbohydrate ABC transporter permease [Candidatus Eremiobacteraeota bacterium]
MFTSSLAAYSFARLRYPGRDTLFFLYLATIMVPMQIVIIPNFIVVTKLGWIDTYNALILPVMFSAYGTFMLRQFILGIPRDLEDAALIDGCSRFRIYWNIILPLSKPALATLATFTFMTNWNSFFWPLVVTSSMEMKILPVGLAAFQGKYNTDWTMLMAAAVITLLPVVIVYLFNQRFITKGIALTGKKA